MVAATSSPESCRVLVRVIRGFDLPARKQKEHDPRSPVAGPTTLTSSLHAGSAMTVAESGILGPALPVAPLPSLSQVSLCPFVEVVFQGETSGTSTAQGTNPTWNEELALKFTPLNEDFSPDNLQVFRTPPHTQTHTHSVRNNLWVFLMHLFSDFACAHRGLFPFPALYGRYLSACL